MFKELFKDEFNAKSSKQAYEYLITNTLDKKLKSPDKLVEITGMDFESTYNKDMLPSMIYTFKYKAKNENTIGKVKFSDAIPLILCFTNENGYVTGINFNYIPNSTRADLLDIIYKAYKDFYENKLSDALKKGVAIVNNEFASFLIKEETRNKFLNLLTKKLSFDVSKTYRKYEKSKIKDARLIEFDMWKYIPFLTFKDAIRGASLSDLQKQIISNK